MDTLHQEPSHSNPAPPEMVVSESAESYARPPAGERSESVMIRGVVRIGAMRNDRDRWEALENTSLHLLLDRDVGPDTVFEGTGTADLSIVDADVHHWPSQPSESELDAFLAAVAPTPDGAWRSHGHGLKLLYTGRYHRARALAAALSLPRAFRLDLMSHSRHPRSARSDRPGAACGPVVYGETDPNAEFRFQEAGSLTPELRDEALRSLDMVNGGRYGHERCLIDPHAETTAPEPVVILERGIYCHRCASHGNEYREGLKAGFVPFSALISGATTVLGELARNLVHWSHARHVLRHHHSNLSEKLLKEVYRAVLAGRHGETDPRLSGVFNEDLNFVRVPGAWLALPNFAVTTVDSDAAGGLPYCQIVVTDKEGNPTSRVDPVKRSRARFRDPEGYTPLRIYRGITFADDDGSIPVAAPSTTRHHIELLRDPMPLDAALVAIERAFPLVNSQYLKASLAAAICAEAGGGQPPMLTTGGPSGSGKGETIRLAASFLGEDAVKVQLGDDPEAFMRCIGALLAAGHRFLVFDEFGKVPRLYQKLGTLLQLGSEVAWRPLYQNTRIVTPCRAAFFFPCVTFPDALVTSAEFIRRTRHVQLFRRTPNWSATCGGDTASWRDRSAENARAANSFLTHVWRLCHERRFRFL